MRRGQLQPQTRAVLERIDAGEAAVEIAKATGFSVARVHNIAMRNARRFKRSAKDVRRVPEFLTCDSKSVWIPVVAVRAAGIRNAEKLNLHVEPGRIVLTRME